MKLTRKFFRDLPAVVSILISVLILLVFILDAGSASLQRGNPPFNLTQTSYGPNQVLEGFLNISLINEPANSKIKALITKSGTEIFAKEVSILDFLKNSSAEFNCSDNCTMTYSFNNPSTTKVMNLIDGSEVYYGLVLNGQNVQVQNLSFLMQGTSTAEPICYETPFKFDLIGDNAIDLEYKEALGWCSKHSSDCFNSIQATETGSIEITPSCQKIFINKAGKIKTTALLARNGEIAEENDLEFFIKDMGGNLKGSCKFSGEDISENVFKESGCVVGEDEEGEQTDFYIEKADYYFVCLKKIVDSSAEYSIKKESQQKICGFFSEPPFSTFTEDYGIYVQESKFSPFKGEVIFNETTKLGSENLLESVQAYLSSRYNNNCSSGCVIPLRFLSLASQKIELKDLNLKYSPQPGASSSRVLNFYDISAFQPKIDLSQQSISLTAMNITSPEQEESYHIKLYFNNNLLGQSLFRIEPVPIISDITPKNVVPGQTTMFFVQATASPGNAIINYTWQWGDGSEETTAGPKASHIYNDGIYSLIVKATDSSGKSGSRIISVNASLTKETLNRLFLIKKQAKENFSNLQIESWYRDRIFNLTLTNDTLNEIEIQLNSDNPDLNNIKLELDSLKIPKTISNILVLQESFYFPDKNKINLAYLSDLGAGTFNTEQKDKFLLAITNWQENSTFKISGFVKKIIFDDLSNQDITLLTIRIIPSNHETAYFIFETLPEINVSQIKIQEKIPYEFSDAVGLNLSDASTINLFIPAKQEFSEIVFYASPSFNLLDGENENPDIFSSDNRLILPIALAFIVLIVFIVLLIIIWKGKRSESNLFVNDSDLLSLTSYIRTSLEQGKTKKEIEQELVGQNWTKKQIDYAFKNKDQNIDGEFSYT